MSIIQKKIQYSLLFSIIKVRYNISKARYLKLYGIFYKYTEKKIKVLMMFEMLIIRVLHVSSHVTFVNL